MDLFCSDVIEGVEKVFERKYDVEGVVGCFIRFKCMRVEKTCSISKMIIEVNNNIMKNNVNIMKNNVNIIRKNKGKIEKNIVQLG